MHAGLLLAASRRIVVATGIASIWARDATATATASLGLAEAYPGRFLLGLGVSHQFVVEARGHVYVRPLARMRQYLDELDGVDYRGPAPEPPLTRVLAALRPPMLELAKTRAGGAHPYFVPVEHTARARAILGSGPLLAPEQFVLLESDPAKARSIAREHMALYLAAPNYQENLRWLGWERRRSRERRLGCPCRCDRRLGRRERHPRPRSGAPRRRCRPRLRPATRAYSRRPRRRSAPPTRPSPSVEAGSYPALSRATFGHAR